MDKNYINKKIKNCKELVNSATSDAQRAIYIGYLEFWQKKTKKTPKKINIKEAKKAFKLEFPNKKSHYTRNDKLYRTKSFKEFLKSF